MYNLKTNFKIINKLYKEKLVIMQLFGCNVNAINGFWIAKIHDNTFFVVTRQDLLSRTLLNEQRYVIMFYQWLLSEMSIWILFYPFLFKTEIYEKSSYNITFEWKLQALVNIVWIHSVVILVILMTNRNECLSSKKPYVTINKWTIKQLFIYIELEVMVAGTL